MSDAVRAYIELEMQHPRPIRHTDEWNALQDAWAVLTTEEQETAESVYLRLCNKGRIRR